MRSVVGNVQNKSNARVAMNINIIIKLAKSLCYGISTLYIYYIRFVVACVQNKSIPRENRNVGAGMNQIIYMYASQDSLLIRELIS
jgi:hypothetical protein